MNFALFKDFPAVRYRELSPDGFGVEKKVLAPMSGAWNRATKTNSQVQGALRLMLPAGRVVSLGLRQVKARIVERPPEPCRTATARAKCLTGGTRSDDC